MPQRVTVIDRRGIYVVEQPASQPYLVAVGAAPLRFSEAAPEPTEVPLPRVITPIPVDVAEHSAQAPVAPTPVVAPAPAPAPVEEKAVVAPVENHGSNPLPVLLDDTPRRPVRAEDVLPFFQFPGSGGSSPDMILPPAATPPRTSVLPPSSATYQQK